MERKKFKRKDYKNFLDKETINFIKNSRKYIGNYKCIQNFTNDVALNYLLRKENCSKFYMVFSLGSKKTQNELIKNSGVHLYLLRVYLIHPAIGGNKLFKLKYNLEEAKKQNKNTIITFRYRLVVVLLLPHVLTSWSSTVR